MGSQSDNIMTDSERVRRGLFSLHTARIGKIGEIFIRALKGYGDPQSKHHDLFDITNDERVEVKCSKVLEGDQGPITQSSAIQQCIDNDPESRPIPYNDREDREWLCNIQQIKRAEFEKLYYILFFKDKICIFCIRSEEIADANINYSDRQHKGNEGEGQFHITHRNIKLHLDNYLDNEYTYEQFIKVFEPGND